MNTETQNLLMSHPDGAIVREQFREIRLSPDFTADELRRAEELAVASAIGIGIEKGEAEALLENARVARAKNSAKGWAAYYSA